MTPVQDPRDNPLFLESLDRAFLVIECFEGFSPELSNKQIQEATGLTFQTVDRILKTLEMHRLVKKDSRKKTYRLSLRALDFQYQFLSTDPLIKTVWPLLADIREKTRGRVSYCELDGTELVYLARVAGNENDYQSSLVGRRRAAFVTAGGRAIMSQLPSEKVDDILLRSDFRRVTTQTETDPVEIKASISAGAHAGYVVTRGETILGETSYAAPVLGSENSVCGAIVISVRHGENVDPVDESNLIALLLAAARAASSNVP